METVDLPDINFVDVTVGDALLKFYKDLGFEPDKHFLKPNKIKPSKADHVALHQNLINLLPDNGSTVTMFLLNYGPSCDESIEAGKVHLYDKWIEQ